MQSRREFLKRAAILSSAAGFSGVFPETIQRAFAIDPAPGSTYMDAEHVVILMQENRSFDHALGTLRGVRGFNDPRALNLANENPVWLQTNAKGETYGPFRLNIKDTRSTWMSYLPHTRESQVDAWNRGLYDQWLEAKPSRKKEYADMPLTMGHYTREDIPFYYALADAFTVCDQYFSGVMTSTTPNRSMFWTGSIREEQKSDSMAFIRNYTFEAGKSHWETFPERLQKNGVSWKFYQNDVAYVEMGLTKDEDAWCSNFGCNLLELFAQYRLNHLETYQQRLPETIRKLEEHIASLQQKVGESEGADGTMVSHDDVVKLQKALEQCRKDLEIGVGASAKLPAAERDLHQRAFTTNTGDPHYQQVTMLELKAEDGKPKSMSVPKGDVLYQFREDVKTGNLPTVSWLAGSENFSDHPTAPWYGAWYVSEVMNILTQNPEVWKKTIFVLTYDENDGYFDHIPPFAAPDPRDKTTGKVSPGLETEVEYVYVEDELKNGIVAKEARTGPVGLGYRVPMIVASPWSRGGWVNSQLFNHTSMNQFLEQFLNTKYKCKLKEDMVSPWRRAISGDLTTVFRPFDGRHPELQYVKRDPLLETIYNAKFQPPPSDFHALSAAEVASVKANPGTSKLISKQEPGVKPSCAIPYELYVESGLSADGSSVEMHFSAGNAAFGAKAMGSPFNVYARGVKEADGSAKVSGNVLMRSATYTVAAGDTLMEQWPLASFADGGYHLAAYGPNGFFREFAGDANDPALSVACQYETRSGDATKLTGNVSLRLASTSGKTYTVEIVDHAYGAKPMKKTVSKSDVVVLHLEKSFGWYDFSVRVDGSSRFVKRYAGRVETGRSSFSDPLMGGELKA